MYDDELCVFFFQAEDGIRDGRVTGVQTCALPISFGAPVHSLRDIPAGDYFLQAILNIYTEFHRADGHRVWLHMDQWERSEERRVGKECRSGGAAYDYKNETEW